ncbi:MAG: dihydroorotate dehydrogenase electron transfer subunit [Coriobacteriia bacterium]|nr:dihydroorotate dehydrogenase electron transfer subunit [Coriobacteriia bacterium]
MRTAKEGAPQKEAVEVLVNYQIAPGVFRLHLRSPQVAEAIEGGQFVHLRINGGDTLLRRPLSVCQADNGEIHILYAVVGKGTSLLAEKPIGDNSMDVLGPLGREWPIDEGVKAPLLVGGGLGIAPLGKLAHYFRDKSIPVTIIQGGQNAERLLVRDDHKDVERDIRFATDDGSFGYHGLVTELVKEAIAEKEYDRVYICGPEVMQQAVSKITLEAGIETFVSFERRMACGIGACLGCVIPTTEGLKRVCADGPVFNATEVMWDDAVTSRV